jgi:hypothetical protein
MASELFTDRFHLVLVGRLSGKLKERRDQEDHPDRGAEHIHDLDASFSLASLGHPDTAPETSGEPLGSLQGRILHDCDHGGDCDPTPSPPEQQRGDDRRREKQVGDDHAG